MQLETMQYFDSTMQGAPPYSSNNFNTVFAWAMTEEKVVIFNGRNGQLINFINGHGMTELTLYMFVDEVGKEITSRVKIISSNEVEVLEDISSLNAIQRIYAPFQKWIKEDDGGFLEPIEKKFKIKASGALYFHYGGSSDGVGGYIFDSDSTEWIAFVSQDSIVFLYKNNGLFSGFYWFGLLSNTITGGLMSSGNSYVGTRAHYQVRKSQNSIDWGSGGEILTLGRSNGSNEISVIDGSEDPEILPCYNSWDNNEIPRLKHYSNGGFINSSFPINIVNIGVTKIVELRTKSIDSQHMYSGIILDLGG